MKMYLDPCSREPLPFAEGERGKYWELLLSGLGYGLLGGWSYSGSGGSGPGGLGEGEICRGRSDYQVPPSAQRDGQLPTLQQTAFLQCQVMMINTFFVSLIISTLEPEIITPNPSFVLHLTFYYHRSHTILLILVYLKQLSIQSILQCSTENIPNQSIQ